MSNSLDRYVPDFLVYIKEVRGGSQKTATTYGTVLKEALGVLAVSEGEAMEVDLLPYRLQIARQHAKTVAKKVSTLRSFFSYLETIGVKVRVRGDTQIKVPKTLPKPVPTAHIKEALAQSGLQERTVITLLYALGLRISELADLKLEDITNGWVRVTGKGNKTRMVPLLPEVQEVIESYVRRFGSRLFLMEEEGKRLRENRLRLIVTKSFGRIGIKVTPHQLRHSYATDLLGGGARITDVSELLGHSALSTTEIYTKLGSALKLDNYLKAHPLCKGDDES